MAPKARSNANVDSRVSSGRLASNKLSSGNVFRTLEGKPTHLKTHSVHHEVVKTKISPRFEEIVPVKEAKLASNASMTGLTPEDKAKYA